MAHRTDERTSQYAEGIARTIESGGPGLPGTCPACQGPGHLDAIVPSSRTQEESCPHCGCAWERLLDDGSVEIVQEPTD